MMEWHRSAVLIMVFQITVYEVSLANENVTSRSMVAFCNPQQNFICLNLTHYTPCVVYDSSKPPEQRQYYCGDQRCCRPGAISPCGVHCRGPIFPPEEYVLMWNFRQFKKKIRRHVPLDSEEIERRNRIVSVKNFIVRQKDLEIYQEDYEDEMEWKPSYRTFCPAYKQWVEATTTTALEVSTTTGGGGGGGGCCGGCCCCCCCCCSGCEGTTSTHTETTTQLNTTIATPTTTMTTPQITTTIRRSKDPTTRTRTTRRTRKTVRPTKPKPKPNTCKKHGQKLRDPNNCANYYLCIEKLRGNFEVRKRHCPPFHFFSITKQMCLPMEEVECSI